MDLIYTDEKRKDVGVMMAYTLDMAYGSDENDFECTVGRDNHCCRVGCYLYVDGEDYGGYIDSIKVDTEKGDITYKGRTWYGILESGVICPPSGQDYAIFGGEANTVLGQIIEALRLGDLFSADTSGSGITINNYQMERYVKGYTGIRAMLKSVYAKLRCRWHEGKVILSAEPAADYSQDEEWDTSQVDYTVTKNYHPVNHMICMGQGDLKDRAVIHIFTDAHGGIQKYAKNDPPLQDSDYILDESGRVISGMDEVADVLDEPSSSITTNYILTTAKPSNWDQDCEEYFTHEIQDDGDDSYSHVRKHRLGHVLQRYQPSDWSVNFSSYYTRGTDDKGEVKYSSVRGQTVYNLLGSQPADWATNYGEYYTAGGGSRVSGIDQENYVRQGVCPGDWATNYGTYYSLYSDGVTTTYRRVSGINNEIYQLQTSRPSDWATNYSSYYRRATAKELKKNKKERWKNVSLTSKKKVPGWQAGRYYTRISFETPPNWGADARFTLIKYKIAPAFAANTYYVRVDNSPPSWAQNTYYTNSDEMVAPEWTTGTYFRAVEDRYAALVESAKKKLEEAWQADDLDIDLEETDQVYDIGDLVGCIEHTTGITTIQEVSKKIIKITNNDISIKYEVK